jgi:hypothetical protein
MEESIDQSAHSAKGKKSSLLNRIACCITEKQDMKKSFVNSNCEEEKQTFFVFPCKNPFWLYSDNSTHKKALKWVLCFPEEMKSIFGKKI